MREACKCVRSDAVQSEGGRTYVVDETILGRVVLGLQRTEERLLRTEDLDGTCWVLC